MEEKYAEVRIMFSSLDKKQIKHLFKAEKQLKKAGIRFDTGFYFRDNRRDWKFDWSLKGAVVLFKKFKN